MASFSLSSEHLLSWTETKAAALEHKLNRKNGHIFPARSTAAHVSHFMYAVAWLNIRLYEIQILNTVHCDWLTNRDIPECFVSLWFDILDGHFKPNPFNHNTPGTHQTASLIIGPDYHSHLLIFSSFCITFLFGLLATSQFLTAPEIYYIVSFYIAIYLHAEHTCSHFVRPTVLSYISSLLDVTRKTFKRLPEQLFY